MDMKLERVGFSDPRYVVRDLLDKGKCDVMLGVDAGDPRVATTRAYYRSSYVFVTRADFGQEVTGWDSPALQTAHIGVIPGTPAEVMLVQLGRYADSFRYMMSLGGNKAPRNRYVRYDSEKLIRDLAAGEIDVAVAWAPSVARYIKSAATPLKVTQVPAQASKSNGEPVHFHFDTAIAVRKDDHALLARIEAALARSRDDIEGVLRAEAYRFCRRTRWPKETRTARDEVSSQQTGRGNPDGWRHRHGDRRRQPAALLQHHRRFAARFLRQGGKPCGEVLQTDGHQPLQH